jgi:L-alanine-DL-glutamate epimerase-like enolase superfamily enzyme
MKITGMEVWIFEPRPNHHQEVPAYQNAPTRQNGIARILTDEGIEGVYSGTASRLREFAARWSACRRYFPLEGQDPFERGRIKRILSRRFYWPTAPLGILDTALWDIAGKALGKPIYKLLGATRDRVRAYGSTIHHAADKRFIATVLGCQKQGFTAVKLHPYCTANDDIRLCTAVRKAVGDDFTLMIDTLVYPAPYTREEALRVGRVLDALNFWWYEDPLPKTDLEGLADVTTACQVVQIRSGDRVDSIHEYPPMIQRRCMDIMAGPAPFGITDLMKLAHLADANHMNMEPHDFGGGTKSLHFLLAVNNAQYYEQAVPEGCFDTAIYPKVYRDPVTVDDEGYVHAPTKPGLGYEIDLNEAKNVTIERLTP